MCRAQLVRFAFVFGVVLGPACARQADDGRDEACVDPASCLVGAYSGALERTWCESPDPAGSGCVSFDTEVRDDATGKLSREGDAYVFDLELIGALRIEPDDAAASEGRLCFRIPDQALARAGGLPPLDYVHVEGGLVCLDGAALDAFTLAPLGDPHLLAGNKYQVGYKRGGGPGAGEI